MKLVADAQIPLVEEYFASHCDISILPTAAITADAVRDADILLIRSTLAVNAELLTQSRCQFVATTTSGFDHIDTQFLTQQHIAWAHAPGCNATSVAEYILACLAWLTEQRQLPPLPRMGIIGVGHVGSRVAAKCQPITSSLQFYDPPRQTRESAFQSCALNDIFACDVISIHTPLTHEGDDATWQLLNAEFFAQLTPGTVIINAARGGVLDQEAAIAAPVTLICDVFANEPAIDVEFAKQISLATPHIAGHAIQAKWRGTQIAYQAIANHFAWPTHDVAWPALAPKIQLPTSSWHEAILALYDPCADASLLASALAKNSNTAAAFKHCRTHYPLRHEFTYPSITNLSELDAITQQLILA